MNTYQNQAWLNLGRCEYNPQRYTILTVILKPPAPWLGRFDPTVIMWVLIFDRCMPIPHSHQSKLLTVKSCLIPMFVHWFFFVWWDSCVCWLRPTYPLVSDLILLFRPLRDPSPSPFRSVLQRFAQQMRRSSPMMAALAEGADVEVRSIEPKMELFSRAS